MSKRLSHGLCVSFSLLWYAAGLSTLLSFVLITKQFIVPEMPAMIIMLLFLVLVCFAAQMDSISILLGTEILLWVNAPLILFILFKSIYNEEILYDSAIDLLTHALHVPAFENYAAATFIFSGYTNMVIFNRVFDTTIPTKWIWILVLPLGIGVLLTSFLSPVAYHGTVTVARYIFPWIVTADAIRLNFFLIERLMFIFLLVYVTISLVSAIIHWHVCIELIKSSLPKRPSPPYKPSWWLLVFFAAVAIAFTYSITEPKVEQLNVIFQQIRFPAEIILVLLISWLSWRRQANE